MKTLRLDLEFTRTPGGYAEPIPTGKKKWKTPLDGQRTVQPCTARRVLPWGFSAPIRLRRGPVEWDPEFEEWVQVWLVPARATHPGDHIELGPTPRGVQVRLEGLADPLPTEPENQS